MPSAKDVMVVDDTAEEPPKYHFFIMPLTSGFSTVILVSLFSSKIRDTYPKQNKEHEISVYKHKIHGSFRLIFIKFVAVLGLIYPRQRFWNLLESGR